MKTCPFCGEKIRNSATKYRYCGEFLSSSRYNSTNTLGYRSFFDYRSPQEVFGIPLVQITHGFDPQTGRPLVARGVLAVGDVAECVFALGGFAAGFFSFGSLSVGMPALGGLAAGIFSLGDLSVGLLAAVGGLAVSAGAAIGELGLAPLSMDSRGSDPEFVRFISRIWPDITTFLGIPQ